MTADWLPQADGASPWSQAHVVVAGIGVSGFRRGRRAAGVRRPGRRCWTTGADQANSDKATLLETLGGTVRLGPGSTAELPADADLVITTGWPPTAPLLVQAAARGVPIWSEVELAWRLSQPGQGGPVARHHRHQRQDHHDPDAGRDPDRGRAADGGGGQHRPADHGDRARPRARTTCWRSSCPAISCTGPTRCRCTRPRCSTCSPTTWSGTARYDAYVDAKATIYSRVQASCVYNVDDPATERMVEQAEVVEGARAIGFTLGMPGLSMLGVVDDLLVDRAFIEQRRDSALELARVADVPGAEGGRPHRTWSPTPWPRPRSPGRSVCRPPRSATGCGRPARGAQDPDHGRARGVRWVDDSKATNPHAADAALRAYEPPAERGRQDRLDRRRAGEGHHLRRADQPAPGSAARRCAARRGP